MLRKLLKNAIVLLCAVSLLGLPVLPAQAAQTSAAVEISGVERITNCVNVKNPRLLFDKILLEDLNYIDNASITLGYPEGIGSLYLVFTFPYGEYTLINEDTGETSTLGSNGFLNEFVDLVALFGTAPKEVTLQFENGRVKLNELRIFTPGQVPEDVQRWEPPKDGATDLILFSAHGDDEQLFFAGLLPYYAGELGYQVQVVYLTNHLNHSPRRMAEMLNGLWAVGVDTYPIFGPFPDLLSESMEDAYRLYQNRGFTEDQLISFVVEQLRRFHPKAVVGHDVKGEYGHGMHILYTDILFKALEISNDPQIYPELAEQYGLWDVPKTYIHLYPENRIELDWDQPLERFDGMTAFQVSRDLGYPCHLTQYRDFAWYYQGAENSTQIKEYSPREYGLYRSLVGEDTAKNDIFENLTTHGQDAELERYTQELLRQDEERRQEEARKRQEAEQEAKRQQEAAKQETAAEPTQPMQALPEEPKAETGQPVLLWVAAAVLALLAAVGLIFGGKRGRKNF